jgi:hypothetical protein
MMGELSLLIIAPVFLLLVCLRSLHLNSESRIMKDERIADKEKIEKQD